MNALEEASSLKEDPLPAIVFAEPLTRVYQLDAEIERIRELLTEKSHERNLALQYAIDNNVTEDAAHKLNVERAIRKSRTLNLERFREVFPSAYNLACQIERKQLEEQLTHVGERIALGVVDKLIPKANLAAAQGVVIVKESETLLYSVVRK
jgi:hypothetical protein